MRIREREGSCVEHSFAKWLLLYIHIEQYAYAIEITTDPYRYLNEASVSRNCNESPSTS